MAGGGVDALLCPDCRADSSVFEDDDPEEPVPGASRVDGTRVWLRCPKTAPAAPLTPAVIAAAVAQLLDSMTEQDIHKGELRVHLAGGGRALAAGYYAQRAIELGRSTRLWEAYRAHLDALVVPGLGVEALAGIAMMRGLIDLYESGHFAQLDEEERAHKSWLYKVGYAQVSELTAVEHAWVGYTDAVYHRRRWELADMEPEQRAAALAAVARKAARDIADALLRCDDSPHDETVRVEQSCSLEDVERFVERLRSLAEVTQ